MSLSVSMGSQKLDTALQMWSHQCQTDGKNHFPGRAGYSISNISTVVFFCCQATLLAYIQLDHYNTVSFSPESYFPARWSPACAAAQGFSITGLGFYFESFFGLDEVSHRQFFNHVEVPLNSNPALHILNAFYHAV